MAVTKKYTATELAEVLRLHAAWLRGEKDGVRADLREANLRWADLSRADLREANLIRADLSKADLSWADLSVANLRRADLSRADLSWANLSGADLREANLTETNLINATLIEANLTGAMGGEVARLDFGEWSICVRSDATTIGCEKHANEKWLAWLSDSPEMAQMHCEAPAWWAEHGEAVKAVIRCVMAKAERNKLNQRKTEVNHD